eukprot:TRINITY_DN4126_c0_g1_i1.p1 TRINITY_DN4126_c0_g1~~TRINITY_DN4126_c0_g1_i1.p1  ORF type:complete len:482 (-),score=97.70 TRINITY_DN4126_c0_g1_i1:36-1481(-)
MTLVLRPTHSIGDSSQTYLYRIRDWNLPMIAVRVRGPKGLSQLNDLDPNTKISDLLTKIEELTGVKVENQRLLSGFPPAEIDISTPTESTITTKGIKNGDSINVQEKALANTQATAEEIPASGGLKRKRETKTKSTKKTAATKATGASASSSSSDGAVIHTLHGKIFGAAQGQKKKSTKPAGKRQKRAESSKDDEMIQEKTARTLEEALIQAVTTEETDGDDPLTKFMRSGVQDALREREQETLATYRYQALLSGKYKFEFKQAYTVGTGAQPIFRVAFPTDYGDHVEEQEALTRLQLYSIVQLVIQSSETQQPQQSGQPAASSSSSSSTTDAPAPQQPEANGQLSMELLKPYKMALVSPRVFWSMIYHFRYVDVGLKLMFPDKDWSFLDNRKREMSDRAKHNEKMKAIYEKLDKEQEITDEDLIAAGLMEPKSKQADSNTNDDMETEDRQTTHTDQKTQDNTSEVATNPQISTDLPLNST